MTRLPISDLIDAASSVWRIDRKSLLDRGRFWHFMPPRRAVYLIGFRQGYSASGLARTMGRSDHSTALHHIRHAEAEERSDPKFRRQVRLVRFLALWRRSLRVCEIEAEVRRLETRWAA